jgi:hypothetical protein
MICDMLYGKTGWFGDMCRKLQLSPVNLQASVRTLSSPANMRPCPLRFGYQQGSQILVAQLLYIKCRRITCDLCTFSCYF